MRRHVDATLVLFAWAFLTERRGWWAAIPAGVLLGLAAVIAWSQLAGLDDAGGAVFLGMVAAGFWAVRARDRRQWWALIPAGAVTTLAVVAAPSSVPGSGGAAIPAVLFLGLAATFLLVAVLPGEGPHRWVYVPAAALAAIGVVVAGAALATLPAADYAAPAVPAAIGLVVLWRSIPHHHSRT